MKEIVDRKILDTINSPEDLKKLSIKELISLSAELRNFIIDAVSANAGHFAANLGVVELTIALHYVFNTPYDKLIWDVGHQAYGHKILTGRKDIFHTYRKYKGISGFPKMEESEYDAFGGGHSSISISAALGIALAAEKNGEKDRKVIAIIGDGSLTGGVAFEGLNNAGHLNTDMLVILNDNNISIDPNVGALKNYLVDITTSHTYNKIKKDIWNVLGSLKILGNPQKAAQNLQKAVKSIFFKKGKLFESFGFRYFGPVDGHDIPHLIKVLNDLKDIPGPKLLHCVTVKGKGFSPAELNQTMWHAPGVFDKETGEIFKKNPDQPTPSQYHEVFGETMVDLAIKNEKIVGVTPAMPTGCSFNIMMHKMPDRVYDVGIAEQHAVSFSAGLATQGFIPFCNIYSSFMQRAFDQVIHDVAIQKLNVVFCLDRAGIVGPDGATHHGAYDIAYMRCIPNLTIASPMDEVELRNLLYTAQIPNQGPFVIRYPKYKANSLNWRNEFNEITVGKGRVIKEGKDLAILTIGHVGNFALQAIEQIESHGLDVALYDMRYIKPLDEELLHRVFKKYKKIITIEDGTIKGGFGTSILEFMNYNNYSAEIKILGIPDNFIEHGTQKELYKECGYDTDSILKLLESYVELKLLSKAG